MTILKIPENTAQEEPFIANAKDGIIELDVGENATAIVFEDDVAVKVFVRAGNASKITYIAVKNNVDERFVERNFVVEKDASIHFVSAVFAGKLKESRIAVLKQQGSSFQESELVFLSADESMQINSVIKHEAPFTVSNSLTKGVLSGSSVANVTGKIAILKNCNGSSSTLSQHFLLLDKEAKADAVPVLEIESNDVKAYHAATVSPVDAEHLFYLRSKGMAETEARRMIVESFLSIVIEKMPEFAKEKIARLLEEKWRAVEYAVIAKPA